VRRGHVVETSEEGERLPVDLAPEGRVTGQRLQFGAEQEGGIRPRALPAVIKRLLAEAVAGEDQRFLLAVPQRQGEHADAVLQGLFDAPGLDRGEQGLGIGMAAPRPRQPLAKLHVIVDLAIVDGHEPSAGRGHRLLAGGGEIEDGEPPVAERHLVLRAPARRRRCPGPR
jgi:hypothetical protein